MFKPISSLSAAMRFAAVICAAILSAACGPSDQNVQLGRSTASDTFLLLAESSMVKVMPDVAPAAGPNRGTVEIAVAGGEVVPDEIVKAINDYTRDSQLFEQQRLRIGEAIESLGR